MKPLLGALLVALCAGMPVSAQELTIHHLSVARDLPPTLSNLDPRPDGLSRDGAAVGLADNATTGRFMGQSWELAETIVELGDDPLVAARAALADTPFLVIDAPAKTVAAIAALPEAQGAILFNATESATSLREEACAENLLHTAPSTAMLTDALAQFLVMRRWDALPMIVGTYPEDEVLAASIRASLAKFGLEVAEEKTWAFDADMRRNASQEVPLFTQGFGDYDALLVADALDDFARYIPYNTWLPRPVVGSEGLLPTAWAPVVEAWGAAQLQSRFEEEAGRDMEPEDYGAWAAVRSLGEAVTRTGSAEPATLRAFMLGSEFELAGFKGRPLTFRAWNGQLRQPIPLVTERALVASAPLEGFLHQTTELDTLGVDEPETTCTAFQ